MIRAPLAVAIFCLVGCAPKVGSEKWCAQTAEKPKGEWTANTAADYTKYCVLNMKPEDE